MVLLQKPLYGIQTRTYMHRTFVTIDYYFAIDQNWQINQPSDEDVAGKVIHVLHSNDLSIRGYNYSVTNFQS
jgi:hypothetical protein